MFFIKAPNSGHMFRVATKIKIATTPIDNTPKIMIFSVEYLV